MKEKYNGEVIDEICQTILWILRDSAAPMRVSELFNDLKVDDKQHVRYRMQKLTNAGLVAVERTEDNNNIAPTHYYEPTEDGLDWLFQHQDDAEYAVGRKQYIESHKRLRSKLEDYISEAQDKRSQINRKLNRVAQRSETNAEQLENHDQTLDIHDATQSSLKDSISDIRESVSNNREEISKIKQEQQTVDTTISKLEDDIEDIDAMLSKIGSVQDQQQKEIEKLRRALEAIDEELENQSLTDIVFR